MIGVVVYAIWFAFALFIQEAIIREYSPMPQQTGLTQSFKEVAELLKVTRITLERWEKQGIIKTVRINNKPRVKESELQRLMKGE